VIKVAQEREDAAGIARRKLPGGEPAVDLANEVEDRGERR